MSSEKNEMISGCRDERFPYFTVYSSAVQTQLTSLLTTVTRVYSIAGLPAECQCFESSDIR